MSGKPRRYALVGMKHRGAETLVASLPPDEPLTLVRELTNRFDANAVQVWARGKHVGYIPKDQNAALARFIDDVGVFLTENQKRERSTGVLTLAVDEAGGATITRRKAVDARLHLGSNTYPLVEVV